MRHNLKENNKGFTLVELIVVLVILAIIAAVLVPALLGYVDEAKNMQDIVNAKSCLNAAQSELTKLYAKNKGTVPEGNDKENCVIPNVWKIKKDPNGDANITTNVVKNDFTDSVLQKVGLSPYVLVIGIGSNLSDANKGVDWNVTEHDKYTVYFLIYMENSDSIPCFYYNGTWTNEYPRYDNHSEIFNQKNIIQVGELKGIRLQYYCLVNNSGKTFTSNDFWTWIKTFK